jgi:hypothetical protein
MTAATSVVVPDSPAFDRRPKVRRDDDRGGERGEHDRHPVVREVGGQRAEQRDQRERPCAERDVPVLS